MKTKFLLTFLTLNGLLFGTNSTFASTLPAVTQHQSSANLSQIISQSIGLQQDTHSLVEFAINRALIAQTLGNCQAPNSSTTKNSTPQPQTVRGRVSVPTPQPNQQPIIGQIAVPDLKPIVQGQIVNPTPRPSGQTIGKISAPDPTKPSTIPVQPTTTPSATPMVQPSTTPTTPATPEIKRRVIYGGARG